MPENGNNIFMDADAFVALFDKKDALHTQAHQINNAYVTKALSVYTSNFSIGEAVTVLSQNAGHAIAVTFGKEIFQSSPIRIIEVNQRHQRNAFQKFAEQTSKNARFTDMINMVLMEELMIDIIFSFDKHYKQAGFQLLTA